MRRTMENGHQGQFVCKNSTTITQTTRYGMLSSTFNLVSYYASHLDMEFDEARNVAHEMMCRFRKKLETKELVYDMADKGNDEGGDEGRDGEGRVDLFGDPAIVRTKGNPGGPCSGARPRKPRSIGYTKREAEMGDKDSDDDTENDEEEDNEEREDEDTDTDTWHPSKKAKMWV
ncbi:hypothetical protein Vadar_000424 [Vaccinium darrowii]|uniref:Uncharacterized protein n=1 Tax=Vaccinium darrowii TaxID=229202 RepID=A0ACB7XF03_9ERIC|nr:hypothetical protein Vadar_000424 [Vaccinium darrowii]